VIRNILYIAMMTVFFGLQTAKTQPITASSRLDTNVIQIGDQINLTLSLTVPEKTKVFWPFVESDTLVTNIEILIKANVDTVKVENGIVTLQQKLLLTSFDSGYYSVPQFPFKYKLAGDTSTYFAETLPTLLQVTSPEIDTEEDIKPIKPPIHAPVTFAEIAPWAGGGLLLIALVFLTIYILKKRKRAEPLFRIKPKPAPPPHVEALNKLEKLKLKKLWQSGKIKAYYTELTDIIRYYIERRYQITALEETTDEIIDNLNMVGDANPEAVTKLRTMLILADLVKFAKEQPLPLENDMSLNHGIDFVNETKFVPQLVKTDVDTENINIES